MATTTRKTIVNGWDAANNITATADMAVAIKNTSDRRLYYAVTDGGLPAFDVSHGHHVESGGDVSLKLTADETLCLAVRGPNQTVTVTTGAA